MVWLIFFGSSIAIVVAAWYLAKYGDIIGLRTNLGGMFIGTLLLAGATSLPEVLTSISALSQGVPDLAAGNLMGSNMVNMLILAVLDLIYRQARILRRVALNHALSASIATLLIGMAVFFIQADITVRIGWIGLDSLLLMAGYIVGVGLLRSSLPRGQTLPPTEEELAGVPELGRALAGFGLAAAALVVITPMMVRSSNQIAELTGLGASFIGATLVALVTSLPELATTIAAARLGAFDLAVGNLFGSNMFNMFALGLTDVFYLNGRFLGVIDPAFGLVGLLGLLLTCMALIGNLARIERRLFFIEIDALIMFLVYLGGMGFFYMRSVGF